MRYPHLLAAFASEIWAMEPGKLLAIVDLLAMQADGIKFDASEIEARIAPARAAAVARQEGAVAVVPLRGIISPRASMVTDSSTGGGATAEGFAATIERVAGDDAVKAIVIDGDTPGGNVLGIDEASAAVAAVRGTKPIVVQVTGNLASAGYWVGASADEIIVSPSSMVGSIGVRTAYDDMSAALENEGIAREVISAGRFKGEGLLGPLSDDTRAHMQGLVDDYYAMFVARVATGRGVTTAAVRDGFGQGRMLGAATAVKAGMADRVATMRETLARFGVGPGVANTADAPLARVSAFAPQRELRALDL